MTEWILVFVVVIMIAANALFVAAEFSLVTVDRPTVIQRSESGDGRSRSVLAAVRTLSTQLSGAQLGITTTSLIIGFIAEPSVAALLRTPLSFLGAPDAAVTGLSFGLAFVLATMTQMVFGELVPKNLAIARPLEVARWVAGFQRGFTRVSWPAVWLLNGASNNLLRLVGIEPQEELESARSVEELALLVRRSGERGTLDPVTAELVARSLTLGDKTAAAVMTPRNSVWFLAPQDTAAQVITTGTESGHSRFPVAAEGLDDVVGVVHLKHVVALPVAERDVRRVHEVMAPVLRVPGSLALDPLLTELRTRGLQMAVVLDEYGGTAGLVTLEDLVEELVGDIADEHDRIGPRSRRRADGSWVLSGLLRPEEASELLGVELPPGKKYDTLAGLVLQRLGHIPEVGEKVLVRTPDAALELVVEHLDRLRVAWLRATVRPLADRRRETS